MNARITPSTASEHALNYLYSKAEMDRQKAMTSLALLLDHPAGIGDHSTGDYYKNLDEALDVLVDSEDRMDILHKYFLNEGWGDEEDEDDEVSKKCHAY